MRHVIAILCTLSMVVPMAVEAEPFLWRNVGVDPYLGNIAEAVSQLKQLSPEARTKLAEAIASSTVASVRFKKSIDASNLQEVEKKQMLALTAKRQFLPWYLIEKSAPPELVSAVWKAENIAVTYTVGEIQTGEKCDSMVFGRGSVKDVIFDPEDKKPIEALVYEIKDGAVGYRVKLPVACNNLCFSSYGLAVSASVAPRPAILPLVATAPLDEHTIRIRLWDGSTWAGAKRLTTVHGFQSRDLGAELRDAARKGELKALAGCHRFLVEFRDIAYERARGTTVMVNARPAIIPQDFRPQANTFEVQVCNGEGTLTIPKDWLHGDTILVIHSPWKRPELHYPPSGSLKTCTGQQIVDGRCGPKWKDSIGFGEFFRLTREFGVSNYHFVK